jgi:hypothetical protein
MKDEVFRVNKHEEQNVSNKNISATLKVDGTETL